MDARPSPSPAPHGHGDYTTQYSPSSLANARPASSSPSHKAFFGPVSTTLSPDVHTPTPHITSAAPADLSSFAAFDPFADYPPESQHIYSTVPELSCSPTPSRSLSSRSSVSSVDPPESYLYTTKQPDCFTSPVKMEGDGAEWMHSMPMTTAPMMPTASHMNMYGGPAMYPSDPSASWASPHQFAPSLPSGLSYAAPAPPQPSFMESSRPLVTNNAERTRKRRRLTTPAEANYTCGICGKLFGRNYNYKAHMETHDPNRDQPHACAVKGCGKKFVRKTDLLRHHQSVHEKQRNFQCSLCGNMFARKDTLRRHTEDGCAKRFEISSKVLATPPPPPSLGGYRTASSATSSAMTSPESTRRHSQQDINPIFTVGGGVYGREATFPPHGAY